MKDNKYEHPGPNTAIKHAPEINIEVSKTI